MSSPRVLVFKDQVDIKYMMRQTEPMLLEVGHKYIVILDSPFLKVDTTISPLKPIIDTIFGDTSMRILKTDELTIIPEVSHLLDVRKIEVIRVKRHLFHDTYRIEYFDLEVHSVLIGHHSQYYSPLKVIGSYGVLILACIMFVITVLFLLKQF